ncbi:hypothetical protein [Nocardia sp. XZ_19_385]|uniref:hypothetical protein n=1 Tax=Nocardia sp. XZ_19_385 TaxID=2769488 RepID=UPI00189086C4|nr:hypothetical protein [Nocardia sp. XZ_19_385]
MAAAVVAMVTGCGGASSEREPRAGSAQPGSAAEITRKASEFGGVVIPDGASVLDARTESGADTLYRIALSTGKEGVDRLLQASNFSSPLAKVFRVAETTIAGPPLDTSPSILRAEDKYRGSDGKSVYRIVIVDERDQENRYVHIQLFTT